MNQLHETRSETHMDSAPRLLRTPLPHEEESLPGYLVRLTEANHYALPQWWLPLAGFPKDLLAGWQRLHRSATTFGRLAALTGLSVQRLDDWSEETFTGAPLRTCYAQLCPLCLAAGAYCDRLWDELAVTVCPQHHVALLDRCPNCQQRIRWQRGRVSACRCGADWRRIALAPLPQAERRSLVWLGLDETATSEERSWSARCRALLALAPYCAPQGRYLPLKKDTEVAELRAPLEKAASILLGGREAFVAFCWQLERNGLLGRCAQDMRQLADQPELAFLRLSLEKVSAQRGRAVLLSHDPFWQERFQTVEAVQRSLDFTEGQWRRFMQTGKIRLIPDPWGDALEWVDTEQLRGVLNERAELYIVEHTGYELALAPADIYELVEVGLLSFTSGPALDGFADERLSRPTIERLYDVFFCPAKPCAAVGDDFLHWYLQRDLIWFSEVYQTLRKHGLRLSDWIFAIQRGEIQPLRLDFHRLTRGARLTQFFFKREGFVAYLRRQGVELPPPVTAATPIVAPSKRINWSALAQRLQEREEDEQRRFTRQGIESYDVMELPLAARRWPTAAP